MTDAEKIQDLVIEIGGHKQVAKVCNLATSTVYSWISRGYIPKGFFMFLKEKYPNLKTWKTFDNKKVDVKK